MLLLQKKWIFIPFFFIFLVYSSFAQENKTLSGIVTEKVKIKDGTLKITRTAHLPRGKTISGTIVAESESEKRKKREKQAEKLANLVFKIGGKIISCERIFTTLLPDSETVSLQVFNPEGELIEEIPFELSEPRENAPLDIPKTIRKGYTEKITGSFSGDINQAELMVDKNPVDIIAGNENELFFETGDVQPGKKKLSLDYEEVTASQQVNVADYTLEAGRLTLNRGESTFLDVKVTGLEDLQQPLRLDVNNQSAETIRLEGGDTQQIQIFPSKVSETGTWEKRFDIQSIRRGSFSVSTDLIVPKEKKTETEDATKYVEEAIAYEAKVFKVGKMKLVNPTDEPVKAGLHSFYIPSGNSGIQGFMIPEKQEFTLPPNSESWVDIEGYCSDFELPSSETGSALTPASEWIQIEDPGNVGRIEELMVQENIQKRTLADLVTPVNIPGTDMPVTHAVSRDDNPELLQRLLMAGLTEIIDTYDQLEQEGKIETAFSENNKEKTVQAAFWDYAEKLKGEEATPDVLEEKLQPQNPENIWKNIELIGEKAKIYPDALFQVRDENEKYVYQCEYQIGEQPGFQFNMKIADSWKDEDEREQIINDAKENIQATGRWSADSTFYEQEGGLAHNPTSVCAFFNGSVIGGFASSYARAYITTRDKEGKTDKEWVTSTEQLSIEIDTFNIVQMEVIPKPGWSSFVVGSSYVKLLASSSAFDAVAGNTQNSLAYLKVIKFAGSVALKYLTARSAGRTNQSFRDYAKDAIGDELKDKLEDEAIRQINELAEQYINDYSHQTGKTIEEIVGDIVSPPDLEEMLERFLGTEITNFNELLDEGIDASLNLLLVSNTYCTANGGMVVKIGNATESGFVYSRAHYAREELESEAVSQTGVLSDRFYVSDVRTRSIAIETTGIASMMARARGNGQADAYLESSQVQALVGVCKGPAGKFEKTIELIISDYQNDDENMQDLNESVINGLKIVLENKIENELNYNSSRQEWKNVVDEYVRELSQDKFW